MSGRIAGERMPTVLREGPFRFFFYSRDRKEPPHVHVRRDNHEAKFWLNPVAVERSGGLSRSELRRVERIIKENRTSFLGEWNARFNN